MRAPEPPGLLFKHKDTGILVALGAAFAALSALAWGLVGGTGAVLIALTLLLAALAGLMLHLRRSRQAENIQHQRHMQAVIWLHDAFSFRAPLPPLTGWAANPELLGTLVGLIRHRKPRHVVELGSGASTLVMAYALEQVGSGHVTALDHLSAYADQSARRLAEHKQQRRATVHHAPLKTQRYDGESWLWYDAETLTEENTPIDLLVIDGPPRETQPMARYPAVPALFDRLSDHAVIVLDDARRADEQKIVQRWKKTFSLTLEMRASPKGTAILQRGERSSADAV